eukprot:2622684-Amphidinium_carterae.1
MEIHTDVAPLDLSLHEACFKLQTCASNSYPCAECPLRDDTSHKPQAALAVRCSSGAKVGL